MGEAARYWAEQLAAWAIPEEILSQAQADPWRLSPRLFPPHEHGTPAGTPARRWALEALGNGGTVLDVGVGAGAASLALVPAATRITGLDENDDMLAAFSARATELGVDHEAVHGRWPDSSGEVEMADVVVNHHVFYNVPDLAEFALALGDHARRRVVVEITVRHPVTAQNPLWKRFWGIDRPEGPTADDALAVLREAGIAPEVVRDERPPRRPVEHADRVAFVTRRLCLPPERQPEVEAAMADLHEIFTREVVAIWWPGSAPASP